MKTVRFHPDAEAEMCGAAAYYETQQHNLGRRFLASVQDAVNRIAMSPDLYPVVEFNELPHFSYRPPSSGLTTNALSQ